VLGIVNRHGAFADYLALPVENLHEVPAGLRDDEAVFTEPLAAALEVQEQVEVGPGDRVVVVGDGKLGNLVAQTLALTGCALTVIGRHAAKLALLEARGIATGGPDSIRPGQADVAVECTGNSEGFDLARSAVRPRGTIVLKSTYAGRTSLDIARIVVDEITLVGSRCGPFAPALRLLAERRVDVGPLVHARFPLADAVAAFGEAARPGVLKVLVEMGPPRRFEAAAPQRAEVTDERRQQVIRRAPARVRQDPHGRAFQLLRLQSDHRARTGRRPRDRPPPPGRPPPRAAIAGPCGERPRAAAQLLVVELLRAGRRARADVGDPQPRARISSTSNGESRRSVMPAPCSAFQNRFPGRAK
jgi:NADPH:quinone reductase-like Zn-dependent oxidoreductase